MGIFNPLPKVLRQWIPALAILLTATPVAANLTLPQDVGRGIFNNCTFDKASSEVNCTDINNFDDQNLTINLSQSLTLRLENDQDWGSNLNLPSGLKINPTNEYYFHLTVDGNIQNNGPIEINGNISANRFILDNEHSLIQGDVSTSGELTVKGTIVGNIDGGKVIIDSQGKIVGIIRANELTVNSNATVEGNVIAGNKVMNNSTITGNVRVINQSPSNHALVVNNGSGFIGSVNSNSPVQNDGEIGRYINTPELRGNRAPPLLCNTRPEDNNTSACMDGIGAQDFCQGVVEGLDYAIIGASGFSYSQNNYINNERIRDPSEPLAGTPTTPTPEGIVDSVAPGFAPLEVSFPYDMLGSQTITEEQNIAPGRYGTIRTVQGGGPPSGNLVSFTGGGSYDYVDSDNIYYIRKLQLDGNRSRAVFGPGTYFIDELVASSKTYIEVAPAGKVVIHIGSRFESKNETYINGTTATNIDSSTSPGNLIINMHPGSNFSVAQGNQGTDKLNFNGFIYSPYENTDISLGNNNLFQGSILSSGTVSIRNNTSFIFTDEVRDAIQDAVGCSATSGPVIERFRIIQPERMLSCRAAPVRVVACANSDCSERFHGPVSINLQSTQAISWQGGDLVDSTNTHATLHFNDGEGLVGMRNINGGHVHLSIAGSDPLAADTTLCTPSNCETEFINSGLEVDTTPYTRAGDAASSIIRALSTASDGSCQPRLQNQTVPVSIELVCTDPRTCAANQVFTLYNNEGQQVTNPASPNNLQFNANGELNITHTYSDVGALRLNVAAFLDEAPAPENPPIDDPEITLFGHNSLDFYSIPYSLTLKPYKEGAIYYSPEEAFAVAGEEFAVAILSRNQAGNITPSFGSESIQPILNAHFLSSTQPGSASSEVGAEQLHPDSKEQTITNGTAIINQLVWDEVGELELTPVLSSYFGADENVLNSIESTPGLISRFIPAYFELGLSSVKDAITEEGTCSEQNYTYLSQPAAQVQFEVLARNAKDAITRNYGTHYYDDKDLQLAGFELNSSSHGNERIGGLIDTALWEAGRFEFNEDNFVYPRRADLVPEGPFLNESLGLNLVVHDEDGVTFKADSYNDSGVVPMVDLDGALNLLYARLNLSDVSGPDHEPVAIVGEVEVFASAIDPFVVNTDNSSRFYPARFDNCTTIEAAKFNPLDGPTVIQQSHSEHQVAVGNIPDGYFAWQLDGPFDPDNAELLFEYDITASPWLGFPWRTDGANEGPRALAIFGQYRGNDRIIFWLERGL